MKQNTILKLELTPEEIKTLARACDCAEKAMEVALVDQDFSLDFVEEDHTKMDDSGASAGISKCI